MYAPDRYRETRTAVLVDGITGSRVRIDKMEGVWKIMQHSAAVDRDRIASALGNFGGAESLMAYTIVSGVRP